MLTLVLTRHGSTDRSDPEQHLGQRVDIGLSAAGRSAATALGHRLTGVAFERVISSPLVRARETAALAAPVQIAELEPRLIEMDYGDWEGLTYAQIQTRDGARRRAWEADPARRACPGGESGEDVAQRVRAWLNALVRCHAERDSADVCILAVGHSTTNRVLLCVALGVPVRDYRRRFRQDPANLTVLRFARPGSTSATLLLANDIGHVRGLRGDTWS